MLVKEWELAQQMHNYYGARTWQIGSILVAGSLVTTGLSLDPKFAGLRSILLAVISMTAVIFWGFFSMRNRTIWRRHQDRARNIEDSLRVLFVSLPAGDPMRESPQIWSRIETIPDPPPTGLHLALILASVLVFVDTLIIVLNVWRCLRF